MINGVLVERTVKDVVPALKTNAEGLKKVLDDLVKTYKAKQDELEAWKVRFLYGLQENGAFTDVLYPIYRRRTMFKWCRIERINTIVMCWTQ